MLLMLIQMKKKYITLSINKDFTPNPFQMIAKKKKKLFFNECT